MPVALCRALNKVVASKAAVLAATPSSTLLARTTRVLGLQRYAPQIVQHLPPSKASLSGDGSRWGVQPSSKRVGAGVRTPAPGFGGIAHQQQGPPGAVLGVRGGWFG